ncbi:hypothetical protein IWW52_002389 [Coemansia sp. RSA 2704]|nr:hypothetical protein IWW52_002389 [Coemansia sp. RSA 2704]
MEGRAPPLPRVNDDIADSARLAAVVDTNYFIDYLPLIKSLADRALEHGLVIVIPWVVIQELDGLKSSYRVAEGHKSSSMDIGTLARSATRFLDDELGRSGSALRCQKRSEYLVSEDHNDDKILDCCLYFIERRGLPVTILTKDRNLTVKARANGCATCGEWTNGVAGLLSALVSTAGLPADYADTRQPPRPEIGAQSATGDNNDDDGMDIDIDDVPVHGLHATAQHPPTVASVSTYNDPPDPTNLRSSGASGFYSPQVPTASTSADSYILPRTSSLPNASAVGKPVLIYLDELSEGEEETNLQTGQKAAHTISREITQYIRSTRRCALTELIVKRLEKDASISYDDSPPSMKRAFASPPWKSCTTLLTIVIYYWDIFKHVFPKRLRDDIRSALPWIMEVEHLTNVPQVQIALPPYMRFEPYKYAVESDNVFENVRNQASERNAETAKLITVAKLLLAQCALVETDAQEEYRQQITQRWITWQKINS